MLDIIQNKTPNDMDYITFKTRYNETVTLVAGNKFLRCAIREKDDTSLHAPYTHFTRDEIKAILPYLQSFVESGDFSKKGQ